MISWFKVEGCPILYMPSGGALWRWEGAYAHPDFLTNTPRIQLKLYFAPSHFLILHPATTILTMEISFHLYILSFSLIYLSHYIYCHKDSFPYASPLRQSEFCLCLANFRYIILQSNLIFFETFIYLLRRSN
jgi:hypothetical protein